MIIYLLKTIACSGIFYLFYIIFLKQERMLLFNRMYLIFSPLAALVIPLISFTITVPAVDLVYTGEQNAVFLPTYNQVNDNYAVGLIFVLSAISIFFLLRFFRNLWQLRHQKVTPSLVWQNMPVQLVDYKCPPHSLGNRIIINRLDFESGNISEDILLHERKHIVQKHIFDLVYIEFLKAIFWFNPFVHFFKKAIQLNHEFLADASVVFETKDSFGYQQLILNSVYVNHHIPLASSFNFFTTKNRLLMLQKKTKPIYAGFKSLLSIGLMVSMTLFFSQRIYAQENPFKHRPIAGLTVKEENGKKTARLAYRDRTIVTEDISTQEKQTAFEEKYGIRVSPEMDPNSIPPGEGATNSEIEEYKVIVKKAIHFRENGGESREIKYSRMYEIYDKMTSKQRLKVSPLERLPPPIPRKNK